MPDPNYTGRRSMLDMLEAIEKMQKPTILVMQQKWPEGIKQRAGLAGEVMVTCMKAVGCVGMVSDGPSRDIDAIRKMDFQLLLGGVTAGHGEMAIQSINVPVSVGGMDVAPGEMIHMDENGAVKFPAEYAQTVLENARAFLDAEHKQLEGLRQARSVEDIKAAFTTYR
jgi:regulator of RNase E activity RraA